MEPIDELLKQYELAHGNLCPGKLLGIRMAVLGCRMVGVEDPRGADQTKLIVWVEIDRWLADALEAVTGVRLSYLRSLRRRSERWTRSHRSRWEHTLPRLRVWRRLSTSFRLTG
jgi:hypothetical protein